MWLNDAVTAAAAVLTEGGARDVDDDDPYASRLRSLTAR